ncbi:hypothetical protein FY557_00705 [Chryseobacterium sp. SN22]|uniref:hypothetical protein n=1 Tax=Chryseobacterium sp. SN22 TaxID=2606431 RepID=UPI0011EBCEF5|nr:hypothetical protein [Chryseobacterium sp. SN22]KAA0130757.1 hypothetical protein FY557_00705 [Chryseobacterium sp. SN22]
MKTKPHFTALLTYDSTEAGGLTAPVSSGYRPIIKFPFDENLFTGIQKFDGEDLVFPGDSITAEITLLHPEKLTGSLYEGMDFDFFEGDKPIGHGTITGVF